MLWMAIAAAMAIPSVGLSIADMKVAIPSGKLWIPMTRAVISPMRISLRSWGRRFISSTECISCGFSNEGTSRSMTPISRMPPKKQATVAETPAVAPHWAVSNVCDSANSSTNET